MICTSSTKVLPPAVVSMSFINFILDFCYDWQSRDLRTFFLFEKKKSTREKNKTGRGHFHTKLSDWLEVCHPAFKKRFLNLIAALLRCPCPAPL